MMFTSNGFETYFWDDMSSTQRKTSGFFTKSDLEKLMNRRETRKKLSAIPIDDKITDRYYQKAAIRAVCEHIEQGFRKALLVMATGPVKPKIFTKLDDPVLNSKEGDALGAAYDFEYYRKKVNRYVEEHKNDPTIYKLNHNLPLTKEDYKELERILIQELGDSEDYKREYGDTPFGLLIRKIAKLDHDSAMAAFSSFINDRSLNQQQIEFILKIINHIENKGYIEDIKILMKPPFDKPYNFIKMFDLQTRNSILKIIEDIKNNAMQVITKQ